MSGVSVGPRKFPMLKAGAVVQQSAFKDGGSNWEHCQIAAGSRILWNQTKLDMRAYDGQALDFTNIVIQESAPFIFPTVEQAQFPITMLVYDVFSTVPIINNNEDALNLVGNINTNSFIPFQNGLYDVPERSLNPSQVIYGLWRVFAHSRDAGGGVPTVYSSSEFGTGELVVAGEVYWTRYLTIYDWNSEFPYLIPASNTMLSGVVYDVPEKVELAQMARAAQR